MSDVTIESLQLEVQASASQAVTSIDNLANTLGKLKNATKNLGLSGVSKQFSNLNSAVQSVDGSAADKVDKLANSLQKLSGLGTLKISSSVGNQIRNIGGAASSLSGVDFTAIEKLGTALQPLNGLGKATGLSSTLNQLKKIPELANTLNGVNWATFTSQIQQLANALTPLANQLNTVSTAFNGLPTRIRSVVSATNSLSTSNNTASKSYINMWAKARMAYNVIRNGAMTIAKWITETNSYIESMNLFNASMGEYAEEAQNYAEKVGELMGIDPAEWMRNQGVFKTIISGFGVASDKAVLMSKNLTQLGYDLASLYNIPYADTMQKLQSGISGELEPLRRLGYDLSVARLQQEAYNLGIDRSVSSMTQAEKSQLRYYAIMTQVTTAQGDMARTLNSPANQLRVLQAQVIQCARALGEIFIPALNAVLPYAIALAKVIKTIAHTIARFFGFKLPEVDYSGLSAGANAVGGLADNADNAAGGLGKANKAAKKLKNNLLGIDELNILNNDDSSGSGSGGSGGGAGGIGGSDLGIDLPEYDFLRDLVQSKVEDIVELIKGALSEITAVISGFLLAIGTILVVTGANIPLGLGLMAVGAVGLASVIAANWNGMSERLAKTLTLVTAVLGGFLLAIGAFLAFSGVNVPLGAALMVAGAVSLATAATINWKFLEGNLKNALSILTAIISGGLLAMGALFAFTGVDVPLGIALMVAGAIGLATAVGLNWDSMSDPLRKAIGTLEAIVGGALLAFGAILALSGVNVPLGIGLIAAGAISLVSAVALNWNALTGDTKKSIATITALVSGALIGIGAILAFTGVATPLGIAMIAAGAVGIVATASLNWNAITEKVKTVLKEIGIAMGAALIAVGALLAFTGVALPLGIALIAAGAVSLIAGVALNWDSIVNKIKEVLKKIGIAAGAAMLAIGVLLVLTGVGIPIGIALIAAGAGSLIAGVALNWDSIVEKVKGGLDKIAEKFGEFKDAVGKKLDEAGTAISEWAGGVKEWFTKGKDGKNAIDNIKEAGAEWGEKFKEGMSEKFSNAKSWFKKNISNPIKSAIDKTPLPEMAMNIKNNASTLWETAKGWWSDATKDGVSLEAAVTLAKKGWTSVKNWIGSIPAVSQAISLVKSGWTTVKNFVGNIPSLQQLIHLAKDKWTTVKNFVGNIPSLQQLIHLAKNSWSTVQAWVKQHLGGAVSQTINLAKGWAGTVGQWVKNQIGSAVTVTVNLYSKWKGKIKKFLGLSTGGIVEASGGIKLFADGGFINGAMSGFWKNIPMYANGTANAGMHGSMFVAGENGAEMVGHINGQTEVLNRSQIHMAMKSAVISGMAQFTGYWRMLNNTMATSANAVIRSVMVSTDTMQAAYATAGVGYDPSSALAQSIYEDSRRAYDNNFSDASLSKSMRDFYTEYVEPSVARMIAGIEKQADKEEKTIVQVGNRTITDAVEIQQKANGYKFTK